MSCLWLNMAIYAFRMRLLLFSFLCVIHGVACMPEQGVQTLDLLRNVGMEFVGGVTKSMYQNSFFSAEIKCTKGGEKIMVKWAIQTMHCAEMFKLYSEGDAANLKNVMDQIEDGSELGGTSYFYLISQEQELVCAGDTPLTLPDYTSKTWRKFVAKSFKKVSSDRGTSSEDDDDDDDGKSEDETEAEDAPGSQEQESKLSSDSRKNKPNRPLEIDNSKSNNNDEKNKEEENKEEQKESGVEQGDANKKQKRDTGSLKNAVDNATVADTKNQSVVPAGAFIKVPVDGIYLFVMSLKYVQSQVNVSVTVKAVSSYGYLSAIDFPLLPFYAVMCALYSIFLLVWLILCCYYRKDILQIQLWIGAVLFIGFVDEASFLGEYHTLNQTGQSVPGAIIFGEFVWCIKRAMSRMVVIIASIGFGITKPRLGPTLPKILAVGAVYIILGTIEGYNRATTHEANQATKTSMVFLIVLALTDAAICWWIFTALVQTMRTLRLRRNLVKLSLYRHFTNTLIFSILASVAFMIWTIVQRQRSTCITDWKELWVDDAFWHLLFSIILLVMLILWRPSASNQRYAYSPLSDGADDDAEEPMMNDAFAGMKMRGSKDSSNTPKNTSDQMEDDLKWIEDNIPSSVADSTLPSLLDSEEEIMTTKYELSKMQ